ncbi:MAG: sigma-70 family RNA polymerase sigma factor [Candidatus Methylacidiphilales bacterium]|nr:sigma-70 family RNA polymerase sigma factor [Candidatus Methylacidiphilales bacterium]
MSSPLPQPSPGGNEAENMGPQDDELVARTQKGDPSAFDELVRRHQRRVYKVIFNMTHNHEDTNDLLMETFTRAFQSIHTYKERAAFYTWLYRIAVNRTLNFLQKRKHDLGNVSMDDEESDLHNRHEFIDPSQKSVTDQERLKLLQNKLNESMMKLSEEHRAVVTLFDIENFSHAEIAKIVGVTEGTVRSRLHYAHKQLQKLLKNFL